MNQGLIKDYQDLKLDVNLTRNGNNNKEGNLNRIYRKKVI